MDENTQLQLCNSLCKEISKTITKWGKKVGFENGISSIIVMNTLMNAFVSICYQIGMDAERARKNFDEVIRKWDENKKKYEEMNE